MSLWRDVILVAAPRTVLEHGNDQEALDAESRMHEAQAALDQVKASRGAAERQVTELEAKKAALRSDLTRLRTARDEARAGLEELQRLIGAAVGTPQ